MPFVPKRKFENARLAHRELRKEVRRLRGAVEHGDVAFQKLTFLVNATNNVHATDEAQEVELRQARREARTFLIAARPTFIALKNGT
jgi:hypothetical protein